MSSFKYWGGVIIVWLFQYYNLMQMIAAMISNAAETKKRAKSGVTFSVVGEGSNQDQSKKNTSFHIDCIGFCAILQYVSVWFPKAWYLMEFGIGYCIFEAARGFYNSLMGLKSGLMGAGGGASSGEGGGDGEENDTSNQGDAAGGRNRSVKRRGGRKTSL